MAHLKYVTEAGDRSFPLGEAFRVGRSTDNDLSLADDAAVSRQHALIRRAGSAYTLEDLGSQNGTFVARGGSRIRVTTSLELEPGDLIQIGAARLVYELSAEPSPSDTQILDPHLTQVPERTRIGRAIPVGVPEPTPHRSEGGSPWRVVLLAAATLAAAVLAVVLALVLPSVL